MLPLLHNGGRMNDFVHLSESCMYDYCTSMHVFFFNSPGMSVSTLSPGDTGAADVTAVGAEGMVVVTALNSSTVFKLRIL